MTWLTAEEYAEKEGGEFKPRSEEFFLYRDCTSRFRVQPEQHEDPGFALRRHDELAEIGVYDADVDAENFASDFVERFCDHLSIHDLRVLIRVLNTRVNDWELSQAFGST